MNLPEADILRRLGSGGSIESVYAAAGLPREGFEVWWRDQLASRLPDMAGSRRVAISSDVQILRDEWGIPHVLASQDQDLFFGYGFAMAQDRLWQLDYLRRKAMGRLAEILGQSELAQDVLVRTVGIPRLAAREVEMLPLGTLRRLEAFSQGINAAMGDCKGRLPIEFDLLGYDPEPWSPVDSVAIWSEFRWYLTGRLQAIAIPELAKRTLGKGPLYRAFLTPEIGDETIMPRGSYPARPSGVEEVFDSGGVPDEGIGSNNWVVAGDHTVSGAPLLASDPHIAFGSVSCWYEVHLSAGRLNVAGAGYVGVPGIIFGRNERVAWGVTNNPCSQRDLYQEKTDPQHPGHFLYDGTWEPASEITERVAVKGSKPVNVTVHFSRNGPIVDHLLPPEVRETGPVSLRWLGETFSDEVSCMLAANQAGSCDEFRESLRNWRVPTWNLVFADVEGHIGYQCVGRIPIREGWDRGYRHGWDPSHRWQGFIPFEGMPKLADPQRGWVVTANNPNAPKDFPYPLSGTWPYGNRARRIREMIEEKETMSYEDFARMQLDLLSVRAREAVPGLTALLSEASEPRVRMAVAYLEAWDFKMEPGQVAPSIFSFFFHRWRKAVARERYHNDGDPVMVSHGLSLDLLSEDRDGWFISTGREQAAQEAMVQALDDLEERLGSDMSGWAWGRVHVMELNHYLSGCGELKGLLSRRGEPVGGNETTPCSTGPEYMAVGGSNYRLIADLADDPPGLRAVSASGESGHPGSPNYCDQFDEWLAGRYHYLPLDRERTEATARWRLQLKPAR